MKMRAIGGTVGLASTNVRRAKVALAAGALAMGCGSVDDAIPGETEDVSSDTSALSTTANRSLFITMTSVTRDGARTADPCDAPAGAEDRVWTIGHLLKKEAQRYGVTPATYVSSWMNAWESERTINGQELSSIVAPEVRRNWRHFAGGDPSMPLHKAPFYLLAIVNRLDLRKHRPLGEPLGGEVRFIFSMLNAVEDSPPCPTFFHDGQSTIIFEYSPAKSDENEVQRFARRWLDLSGTSGSSYRTALAALTEEVVNSGRLLRVRTNELANPGTWDLMEFEPNPTTKLLERSTIKQSPTMALQNGSLPMSNWIWANRTALYANAFDYEIGRVGSRAVTDLPIGSYSVPMDFDGDQNTQDWFRGSLNQARENTEFWGGPTPSGVTPAELPQWNEARFRFSVGTCRGCHAGETGTGGSLHVFGNAPGQEAGRSAFLKGAVTVPDPVTGVPRSMNELYRRENDLRALADESPVLVPVFGNNYTVRFKGSGKCLDLSGNSSNNGAFSQLWSCHGQDNQRLSLEAVGVGVYRLKYKHSGKCLDIENLQSTSTPSTEVNARVVQRTCTSFRPSQRLIHSVLSGAPLGTPAPRLLKFAHSNLCLLVKDQATPDGTQIVQGTCPASNDFAKGFDLVE